MPEGEPLRRRPGTKFAVERLRLRHLQLIETLERTGNVGQAAAELHVTQSAATKILQDAEQLFGASLFERLAKGMTPTSAGERIVRYARQMLNETRHALHEVDSIVAGGAGLLTIGAIMASMADILPRALAELRRRRPLLTVRLSATTSDEIVTLLEQRKVEVGICRLSRPSQSATFDFEVLFDEEHWVFVGCDHPLAASTAVDLAALAGLPWVLQPDASPSQTVLETALAKAGSAMPLSRVETTSRFAAMNLVRYGGMIGFLPSTILQDPVDRGDLVRLPVEPLRSPTGYGLVTRREEPLSDPAFEFITIVRNLAIQTSPEALSHLSYPGQESPNVS